MDRRTASLLSWRDHEPLRVVVGLCVIALLATGCSRGDPGAAPAGTSGVTDPQATAASGPIDVDATLAAHPEITAGTATERFGLSDRIIRHELIAELGLTDVLTDDVFDRIDAARAAAIAETFPQLLTDPAGNESTNTSTGMVATPPAFFAVTVGLRQDLPSGIGEYVTPIAMAGALGGLWYENSTSDKPAKGDAGTKTWTDRDGTTTTVDGSYGMQGTKLVGDFRITSVIKVDGTSYTEVSHMTFSGDACPDEAGELSMTFEMTTTISGAGASANRSMSSTITAHVGDDAYLKSVDFDVTASTGSSPDSPRVRLGWQKTAQTTTRQTGGEVLNLQGFDNITGSGGEGATEGQTSTAIVRAMMLAPLFVEKALESAQESWRNGGCVVIEVPEGKLQNVKPHETKPFTAHVKQKWEGTELPFAVTAAFSGKESIDPDRIDPAPDTFTMTAGANNYARADLETVSRRGRDVEDVVYQVRSAFQMTGGADGLVINALVCDITNHFTVSGSGITIDFYPDLTDPSSGTYDYTGTVGGAPAKGTGTFRVDADESGGTIDAEGTGTITSPVGTFSASGSEHYTLTPADC